MHVPGTGGNTFDRTATYLYPLPRRAQFRVGLQSACACVRPDALSPILICFQPPESPILHRHARQCDSDGNLPITHMQRNFAETS